jgi:hypothetical protein
MANPIAKTTRGKGRHFQSVSEGGGMTEAGRKAYNRATGSNLQAPAPNPRTPKERARKKSFCARSRSWSGERMRKVGAPGAPTAKNFREAAKTAKRKPRR